MLYPLLRSPLQPLLRKTTDRASVDLGQAVLALFAAGEQGGWYDPSDFSTLFQDSAGTTPVTAAGQPVGLMLDKSGRGNHLSQATATARPLIQQDASGLLYLQPDGVDDSMATAAIDATVDKLMACVGVRKVSDVATSVIMEFSSNSNGNAGAWGMFAPFGNGAANHGIQSVGTPGGAPASVSPAGVAAPATSVLTGQGNIGAPSVSLRRNGAAPSTVVTSQGAGNYGNFPLFLFARNGVSLPFSGRFYGGIVRFSPAASTPSEISAAEAWVNSKTGAY